MNTLSGSVAAKTEADYRDVVRLHLIPSLGHLKLFELRPPT